MPMSMKCWEGAHQRLHLSEWDAAADIIEQASAREIKCCTDDPPLNGNVREAILWAADEIRRHEIEYQKEKRAGRKRK